MTMKEEAGGQQFTEKRLTRALRARLPHYYRLAERLLRSGRQVVPLEEIAGELETPGSQVAEDMAALGLVPVENGSLAVGPIKDVAEHLLGLRPVNMSVLVGMGRLGSAIASYEGFGPYGMRIVAVFDADPEKIGRFAGGLRILPLEQLEDVLSIFQIRLAVLTVPPEDAQEIATRLVRAGVQAIWNFAPVKLDVPEEVVVRNEHIAAGLAHLCNDLREANLRRLPPEE
jgi:redox-sensing transcriptional repressor